MSRQGGRCATSYVYISDLTVGVQGARLQQGRDGRWWGGGWGGGDVGFQQVDVLLRDTFPAPGEILQL